MEHNTKENGKTTCSMAKELRHGQMGLAMKVTMHLGGNMVKVLTNGMMDPSIQVNGLKTKYLGLEYIHGWMGGSMRESGRTTTWRDWASMCGMTEENTKASIKMIRNTDSECTPGLMGGAMKGIGTKGSSMASGPTWC
jgi:hypothetical protein